jgi:F-type H+-transporting ATPase subunit b
MDLITPDLGLLFWTGVVFLLLMYILTKFIWKPILSSVNERSAKISDALELAEKTKAEMKALQAANENLLKEARAERDAIVKDAKETATQMIEDAKNTSKREAEKILTSARETINAEKTAALSELKTQVAAFSLEIAEKIVRGELAADDKQKALADKLVSDINMN